MNIIQALTELKQNQHAGAAASSPSGQKSIPGKVVSPLRAAAAAAAGSGSNSGASTTITANDFLQLLVAEMKNQDPTATTDPNAYIDQLVQVNSLQQLISINQDLTPIGSNASGSPQAVSAVSGHPMAAERVASSLGPKPRQPEAAPPVVADAANPLAAGAAAQLLNLNKPLS